VVSLLAKSGIITGLDIGTSKVVAIISEVNENDHIEVLGFGHALSRGLRKGSIINLETTTDSIKKAISNAEVMAGTKVKSVFAGIAGEHIRGFNSKSTVIISSKRNRPKSRQISSDDVDRAIEQAKVIETPHDRQVLSAITQGFSVDDQDGISEPVGIFGTRLDALVHVVTGSTSSKKNLVKAVKNADIDVEDVMLQPLASSEAVLYPEEKEMGVILIDIGAGTTDVIIYVEGSVWYTAIIPIGGDLITKDIAIGLNTPTEKAEDIKKESGCALIDMVNDSEMINVPGVGGRSPQNVPRRILAEIIEPRVRELLEFVNKEIKSSGYQGITPAGVVITGGSSMLDSIDRLAERVFKLQSRIGYPRELSGLFDRVKDPSFATCIGLVLKGAEQRGSPKRNDFSMKPNQFIKLVKKMKNWLSG
jgi:cell division protein FtsA